MARYKQSRKDRRDESRGMRKYWEKEKGDYRDVSGENRMSGMIKEDHNAPANLPQREVIRKYAETAYLRGAYYDDGIEGIDDLERENERKMSDSMHRGGR